MLYKTNTHKTWTCNNKNALNKLTVLKKAINIHERCFDFSCLDTLDLRQSTFAQWRFEQCQTSCFVDTKLLETIHLEHDNMVQRCIGATKLTSDTYSYLQYKELQEQAPCTAASRCLQHHIFDKIWWDVFMFGYLWPLTSTSECVGSVVPIQSAAEVGCCCIHKSQSKGVRGQQPSASLMLLINLVAKSAWSTCLHPWHKRIQMVHILHNLLGLLDLQHLWNR